MLTVGALGRRKNQLNCILAFAEQRLHEKGFQYVLCGSKEDGCDQVISAARSTPGVVLLDFVADEELLWLYRNAQGFVLPSLLEGFGMPVAEAISCGLVPIISKGTVLEEVAGPGSIAVDPQNRMRIGQAMTSLISMPESERRDRLGKLSLSISGFSQQSFVEGWHSALKAILASL